MSMVDLLHGDCLELMKDIPDNSIDMCLTDPPYNLIACEWDTVIPFEPMWEQLKRIVKDNGAICLFGSEPFSSALRMSNIKMFKYDWTWIKNLKSDPFNARKRPMGGHEIISIFKHKLVGTYNPQKRKRVNEVRAGNQTNIQKNCYGNIQKELIDRQSDFINPDTALLNFKCVHNSSGKLHPTQKPVALLEYLIKTYTLENETVLDFTMGSGSTGAAAKNLNRKFIGIEKDEKYFEVARERIETHSISTRKD